MHTIYESHGNYNFIYQIPQILYSSFISSIIISIINYLSLSQKDIIKIKNQNQNIKEKGEKLKKCLKIKFICFFILELLFLLLFWYYLASFCAIYQNTQKHLLKDTIISYGFSLLYPLGTCLIPAIFRIQSLRSLKGDKECLYKFSKFIQFI